jgi:hypothetical protein
MVLEEETWRGDEARGRRGMRCGCYRVISPNVCKGIVIICKVSLIDYSVNG